jgi:nitronate monooxygenase
MTNSLLSRLGLSVPIIQAPMAGVSTPELAAAVSESGGLGSIAIGHLEVDAARQQIRQVRRLTSRPFNVNVFCHEPAEHDHEKERRWIDRLTPAFLRFGARAPEQLREIYRSFREQSDTLALLREERPAVVSFHFGLPPAASIDALKNAGICLFATATNLEEGTAIQAAGIDAIVAQGYEAGGHRGQFDPSLPDSCLTTADLTRLLLRSLTIPVIAAGGIMDGAALAAWIREGVSAGQLGTAFLLCPESATDSGHRAHLKSAAATQTLMTAAISGRPARALPNALTAELEGMPADAVPNYPIAYDAAKALTTAAKAAGASGYGAWWAGTGASAAREMSANKLMQCLIREFEDATAPVDSTAMTHRARD